MIRTLSILAAVVALAAVVPIFVAAPNETHTQQQVGLKAADNVANHTEGTVSVVRDRVRGGLKGIVTNNNDPDTLTRGAARRTPMALV